jgi:hypothetical protein
VDCALLYKKPKYDAVDPDWAVTPRQHWIDVVRRRMKGAGK